MTERNVTVRLKMVARDYVAGVGESERMTRRLAAAQGELAGSSRKAGDELDRTSRRAEVAGRRTGRGLLYAAAGMAALGAAGGGLKLLPGLLAGSAAAAATLPPMLLGAAGAGGVLITSLKGVGAAAGEVLKNDDPLAGLGRNARAVVAEVKALQPAMAGVRQGFQDRTLENAAANLRILATRVLPSVRGGLNELAADWGDAFDQITVSLADPAFTGAFNSATRGADWFFDLVNARIPATVRSVSTLVKSADPLARAFGQSLINSLDRFNAAISRAAQSGSLERYFARGAKSAGAFMDIVGGVLKLTGLVVREVSKQNGTINNAAASLDRYLASGRAAQDVAGIVHTLTVAYEGLGDVLGPLGEIARDALADPATADAVRTMLAVLTAASEALRVLFGLFQLLPGPMQTMALVGVALAVVVGKVTQAMTMMQAAAGRAAVSLTATGAAGARAGRGLTTAASAAGKVAAGLVALQMAGIALDALAPAAADVELLTKSVEDFASRGEVAGEFVRVFGDDLNGMNKAAAAAAGTGFLAKVGRSIESIVPGVKSLNETFQGGSFLGSIERFKALDDAMSQYAKTTDDLTGTSAAWKRVLKESGLDTAELIKLLPRTSAELQRMQEAAHAGAPVMQAHSERAKLLGGSFKEAALAGRDLASTMDLINGKTITALEGQIRLEEAYDQAAEVVDKYGRVTKKGTHEINLSTDAGRASMAALIGLQQAAVAAADAEVKRTGNTAAGLPILEAARQRFIALATTMTGSATAATELANKIFGIPSKDVTVDVHTEAAIAKLRDAGYEIKRLPDGKWVIIGAKTDEAKKKLREARAEIDRINGKTVTITVRTVITGGRNAGSIRVTGPTGSGTQVKARGGVSLPQGRPVAAATGLVRPDIYPASDPPLYQFAEKETGGELFLPRRGIDRARGRALLDIGASWYGGRFVEDTSGDADVKRGQDVLAIGSGWYGSRGRGSATSAGGGGSMTLRVVVQDGAVRGLVRVEVDEAFGALADAQIYQTTDA